MPIYSSDSDDAPVVPKRLFGRERSLHTLLGGGRAADIILWRDRNLAAAILIGSTVIWSLFEVGEYNFITLLSYISMIMMFTLLIWSSGAGLVDWNPPDPRNNHNPGIHIPMVVCRNQQNFVQILLYFIWKRFENLLSDDRMSMDTGRIGNFFSSLNLLYTGFIFLMTLPALYERYQHEVDYLASKGSKDAKKLYKTIDTRFLNKIPRGPVKEKKKY